MKVESIAFYDVFDNFLSVPDGMLYNREFVSLFEIAEAIRQVIENHSTAVRAIAFINNWRHMYVSVDSYSVHYIGYFNQSKNQKNEKTKNLSHN